MTEHANMDCFLRDRSNYYSCLDEIPGCFFYLSMLNNHIVLSLNIST